jgi:magnesium transporter
MRRAMVIQGGKISEPTEDAALVEAKKAADKVLWLDLCGPTEDDLRLLQEGFGFHPLSIEDVRQTHSAAKLDEYDDYVFQVVMVPFRPSDEDFDLFEVELFYTKGTLVTVHDHAWPALEELWAGVRRDPLHELGKGAQIVYHSIVDRAVDAYFPVMDVVEDRVEALEQHVFDASSREDVLPTLFRLRRSVRQLLRAARNQRESVQRLAVGTVRTLTKETCYQFRDVHDHLILLHDTLDDHRETLGGLRDTYLGVINNRMSEVMKALTVFSAILLPLAFLTGLFGMNVEVPWQGKIAGFWVVLGLCAASAGGMFVLMARRGWLRRMT